jgi:hypothetical protein
VTISGADLTAPISRDIVSPPGKPIVISDNGELKLKRHLDPQTGTLDGSYIHPATATRQPTKTKFRGVFQLLVNEGRAVFQGPEHSGKVVVR